MAKYAVVDGKNVINIIEADSVELAESITGFKCVEYTTEPAEPGGTYEDGHFIRVKPYPSWVLNEHYDWEPPVPIFEQKDLENPVMYIWDEDTISWKEWVNE